MSFIRSLLRRSANPASRKNILKDFGNAGLYLSGSIIQALFALIAQPIYSKHLTSADFGILGYFDSIKNICTPLFILSISSVYLIKYHTQSETENKKLLFNLSLNLAIVNTISTILVYGASFVYFSRMNLEVPLTPFIWYVSFGLLLDNFKNMVLINFRLRKMAMNFFLFSLLNATLNFVLGILMVKFLKMGLNGRMLAPMITSICMASLSLVVLRKFTIKHWNLSQFYSAIRLALPLVLAAYAYIPIVSIDMFFLERLKDLNELGLYSIGNTFANYVQLIFVALSLSFEPDIFKNVANKHAWGLVKIGLLIFVPYAIFILLYLVSAPFLLDILTAGKYTEAVKYTYFAVFALFGLSVFAFLDKILVALGRTKINLLLNTTGAISAIVLVYFLVGRYGFFGALYAKILVAFILVVLAAASVRFILKAQRALANK